MDSLNDIDTDVFRANQIVGSIRHIFRLEPDHNGALNINDIVLQVLRIFRDRIHHHSVTLKMFRLEFDDAACRRSEDKVAEEVVFNLIQNALDAVGDVPQICASCHCGQRAGRSKIALSVDDSGPGIPAKSWIRYLRCALRARTTAWGLALRFAEWWSGTAVALASCGSNRTHFEIVLPREPTIAAVGEPLRSVATLEGRRARRQAYRTAVGSSVPKRSNEKQAGHYH